MPENAKFITQDYKKGDMLFEQGDTGDYIYIIINGSVEVRKESKGTTECIAKVSSGDILGEMAVLTDEPRCASGVAMEATRVIMVRDRTLRLALLNNDLPILKPLTSQLILRFKEAQQQADYYRKKYKKLKTEVAQLRDSLLHYEIREDN
jgi:CRP-like cAMP-binding protein